MDNLKTSLLGLSPEKRKLLEIILKEQGLIVPSEEIKACSRNGILPLSFAERRLWFLEQLNPGSPLYVIPVGISLEGTLSVSILEDSINEIVWRHEIFRTNYKDLNGSVIRHIRPELHVNLEQEDFKIYHPEEREKYINEFILRHSQTGFNLSDDPLIRAFLLKENEEKYILLIIMHHVTSDNWSTGILMHELIEIYNSRKRGLKHKLPEPEVQYADYAVWQNEFLRGDILTKQIKFWENQLEGCSQKIELPTDKVKIKTARPSGAFEVFYVPQDLKIKLAALSRQEDVTSFMLMITVFEILLYRYSRQPDFNIGYPIANRNHSGVENTMGFFVNTLVLRSKLKSGMSFSEVLRKNKVTILESFDNQDIPFEMLVEKLKFQGETDANPLFQVMFVLNNAPLEMKHLDGLDYQALDIDNGTAKFDLILSMFEESNGIKCKLEFNSDIFCRETIRQMSSHFMNILLGVTNRPDVLIDLIPLIDGAETAKLLGWSGLPGMTPLIPGILHRMFELQASRSPENIAVRLDNEEITYFELNKKANRLAWYLIKRGVKREDSVGVFVRRSIDSIISLLGIMKAGAVYVPLDVSYPLERIKYITDDSEIKVLIINEEYEKQLRELELYKIYLDTDISFIELEECNNPGIQIYPENLAYIIYTSGSTGRPKGVQIEHRAIAEHCLNSIKQYEITEQDHILQFASLVFDASIEQIFTALLTGAELIMRGQDIWPTIEFTGKIKDYGLTVINPPTIYWQQLSYEWSQNAENSGLEKVRLVISGGDTMNKDALDKWQAVKLNGRVRLLNAYGPTETTITSSIFDVPEKYSISNRKIPIGKPTLGRKAYILDQYGELSPIGIPGELFIGGTNLARGYKNQSQLTAERFIPDKFSKTGGARLYRTGDLARWTSEGDIEFIGRSDEQIKIRGFRIETGEIEYILKQYPYINDAVVLVKNVFIEKTNAPDKRLAAYLICSDEEEGPKPQELRGFLSNNLPEYMVPAEYILVDEFPLLPSGKIDKKALLELKTMSLKPEVQYTPPRTEIEEKLARIISETLSIKKVGVFDSFFDLGGHSMLAMQAASKIREEFQIEFPLKRIFEKPSISELAVEIVKIQAEEVDPEILKQLFNEFKIQ